MASLLEPVRGVYFKMTIVSYEIREVTKILISLFRIVGTIKFNI